jgi:hypothetical protein
MKTTEYDGVNDSIRSYTIVYDLLRRPIWSFTAVVMLVLGSSVHHIDSLSPRLMQYISRRSCLSSFQILDFLGYKSRFFCHSFYTRFLPDKLDLNLLARFLWIQSCLVRQEIPRQTRFLCS